MTGSFIQKTCNFIQSDLMSLLAILHQLHQVSQKSPQRFPKQVSSNNRLHFIYMSLHNGAISILVMTV